jgi:hypothetical protein
MMFFSSAIQTFDTAAYELTVACVIRAPSRTNAQVTLRFLPPSVRIAATTPCEASAATI